MDGVCGGPVFGNRRGCSPSERSALQRLESARLLGECSRMTPEGFYAQGRRAQFGGRSRRNHSTVAYACLQSEVSSATLAP